MRLRSILAILLLATACFPAKATTRFSFGTTTIELLDSASAVVEATKSDAYTRSLNAFDLESRLRSPGNWTEKDYLASAGKAVHNWPADEQAALRKSFDTIALILKENKIVLQLPAMVQMIKSNGKEEYGAEGYTRENRITLNTGAEPISTHLVAHELFHVFSRYNAKTRDALYALFGFEKCNPIDYSPALNGKTITNPDCPVVAHFITVPVNNISKDLAIILYQGEDYADSKGLGDFLKVGLIELKGSDKDKRPVLKDGAAIVYDFDAVPAILKKIGSNTKYTLHPEEICAEHFAMMICKEKVPQPSFIDGMRKTLADAGH